MTASVVHVTNLTPGSEWQYYLEMAAAKDRGEMRVAALTKLAADQKKELSEISMTGVSSGTRDADKFDAPLSEATRRGSARWNQVDP
jgi:hypothetical protein